jgi:hypothetical protein
MVNYGGDLIQLPVDAVLSSKQLSWLMQECHSGDDIKLHARTQAGWDLYNARVNRVFRPTPKNILKRGKFQWWLRTKLTQWSLI